MVTIKLIWLGLKITNLYKYKKLLGKEVNILPLLLVVVVS